MVACKTVGEYKRNQEKIRKFCLDEAKKQIAASKLLGTKKTHDAINSAMGHLDHQVQSPTSTTQSEHQKRQQEKEASISTPVNSRKSTSNKATTKRTKKKHTATKNINTRTISSRDKLIQIATKNQRQQQYTTSKTPKAVSKAKTKNSTPLFNFKRTCETGCNLKQQRDKLHAEKCSINVGHRHVQQIILGFQHP